MRKVTGMIREIDDLGRLVIPIELRKAYDLKDNQKIEIFVDNGFIMLRKFQNICIHCGHEDIDVLINFMDNLVCEACIDSISELALESKKKVETS